MNVDAIATVPQPALSSASGTSTSSTPKKSAGTSGEPDRDEEVDVAECVRRSARLLDVAQARRETTR